MGKHFHHKPVYTGDFAKGLLNTDATVSGKATIRVLNGPHDSHWHVENPPAGQQTATYKGLYGPLVINRDGYWTYTLDHTNAAVSGLVSGATLTDAIAVRAAYRYRNAPDPTITVTITGA